MRIGSIDLISDAVLAPIAGYTDVGMRDVARRYGAGLTYTEMISCKGMIYGSEKTKELLATTDIESPCAVQIFGSDPCIMAKAITMKEITKFDIIDINMGCPVPKIVKNGEGSALMKDIKTAQRIVTECLKASGKPITVKFRKGFYRDENSAAEFAAAMEDVGVSALTVHGRTREQYYSEKADWDCIASVVEAVKIPVFANGDVTDYNSYKSIKEYTKADGVMIARGAIGNLQIFKSIADINSKIDTFYKDIDIKRDLLRQIEVLKRYYSDRYIYSNMKKQICAYLKGIADSKKHKDRICRAESVDELLIAIDELL